MSNNAGLEKGDVFHWGKSRYGALGDGKSNDVATPVLNEYFAELKSHDHVHVEKIRSNSNFSVAQLCNFIRIAQVQV